MAHLSDHVVFVDAKLGEGYRMSPIPMETLLEAYVDGRADIRDMDAFLDARRGTVTFSLTPGHVKFLATRMLPETLIHSRAQDERIVRGHYDRGDDFFAAFLGETMIYTSGVFGDRSESLEQAQRNKMDLVCRKLRVRPGDTMLDIGCGWGTLALHAARDFGAETTGVTLSEKGAAFGNASIARAGLGDRARIECVDYRAMARAEDMVWGLFMNKYVFSGADASLPLSEMVKAMEKAGFEIQSAENVSAHYALTTQRWDENWRARRETIQRTYGERWYRLWHLFLGWSWRIALQGTSACFQVVANKNIDTFDRMGLAGLGGPGPSETFAGVAAQ